MEPSTSSSDSSPKLSHQTLRSVNKNDIKKVLLSPYHAEIDYCDGKQEIISIPPAYDSSYIGWAFNSVSYYTGYSSPPVSGRSADYRKALNDLRDEFIAACLVCSKETFKTLEILPVSLSSSFPLQVESQKAISANAFRGVEVNLELIIFSLEEIDEDFTLDDCEFPRSAIKQKAPKAYQAVRLRTDQVVFHDVLLDPLKLERLLWPSGLIFLNVELYESTSSFFHDFFRNFIILARHARFIKADFKITEENHGTTFKNCTKGIEQELEKCGVHFVDLFDKVARVSVESAVTDKIRLVLLQAPTCDMIRIRMPIKDIEQHLTPAELFVEDNYDRSVYWPTTAEE